jgi:hypothetical protein
MLFLELIIINEEVHSTNVKIFLKRGDIMNRKIK